MPRNQAFLLLRYTLIIATAYLFLVEEEFRLPPLPVVFLLIFGLASNVVCSLLPDRITESPRFDMAVILGDTLWITLAMLQSGRFSTDFFYLYFFVLLLAAIGENLRLIAVGTLVVSGAYVYVLSVTGTDWSFWRSPSLIRIPFLFTAAAFYGYLVDRTRRERWKASEADRIKSEFLGTISHELRTPLNVMLGYVDLLLDRTFGPLRQEQEVVLRQVQTVGRTFHGFIGHLLDVSRIVNRIESGRERVIPTEVDLDALFDELRAEFPPNLGVPVHWPPAGGVPPLRTDREKVRTIIRNLVENAVKYTSHGSVSVEARCEDGGDVVEIRVSDTGMGIPSEELPHIYDAFRQGRNESQASVPGIGLGLYIVKQYVDLIGADLAVTSTVGVGSSFSLRLPRFPGKLSPKASRHSRPARRLGASAAAP